MVRPKHTALLLMLVCLPALGFDVCVEAFLAMDTAYPEERLARIKRFVEGLGEEIPSGLALPKDLKMYVANRPDMRMSQAFSQASHGENVIHAVNAEGTDIVHEAGHVIFDHNLFEISQVPLVQEYREFRKQFAQSLKSNDQLELEVKALKTKPPSPERDNAIRRLESQIDDGDDFRLRLKEKYNRVVGVERAHPISCYSELFSDALAFAKFGKPRVMVDAASKRMKEQFDDKTIADIQRGRDFSADLKPEEWPDKHPYNDAHLYYGPTHSFIGQHLAGKSKAQRMQFMEVLFRAIENDMKNHLTITADGRFYTNARTTEQANRDLIDAIKLESTTSGH
ncbi:hypothetical protein K2X33_11790 [bacterium]|nr:hypothetical protein [bacterium]